MEEKNNSLFQIERRNEIQKMLHREGKIFVTDLVKKFSVSGATIRTDLNEMEQEGLLIRTHGGAIEKTRTTEEAPLEERLTKRLEQKRAIAMAALEFVSPGDSLVVDGGSTLAHFIYCLEQHPVEDLTVITNYAPHISNLSRIKGMTTIVTGGKFDTSIKSMLGLPAIQMLKSLKADKVFLSATGISVSQGITYAKLEDSEVKKTMIEQGKTKILLTDSSKIGKIFFSSAGSLEKMDILITDWEISEESVKEITDIGVKVIVAPRIKG